MLASGIDYHTVSDVIEQVVHHYINVKRVRIPDMDPQDIAQEIRLKCVQVINSEKYDPEKAQGSPYNFLYRCIHNHLYNLKRGIWTPNNPPCVRCSLWDKQNKKCKLDGGEETCEKMQCYRDAMRIKANLRTPIGFDKHCTEGQSMVFDSIETYELHDLILNNLSPGLYDLYISLTNGESICNRKRNKLRRVIQALLEENR